MSWIKKYRRWRDKCSTGWIENLGDVRDHAYGTIKTRKNMPVDADNSLSLPPSNKWLYQGGLGSCVAHGIANQIYAASQPGKKEITSRLYMYYYARYMEKYKKPKRQGAYPRLAYKAIKKMGLPMESRWKYSDKESRANKKPSGSARRAAMRLLDFRYKWIEGANFVEKLKTALSEGYIVTMGTQVTKKWMSYKSGSGDVLDRPGFGEDLLGGHYVAIYGYKYVDIDGIKTLVFLIANSWHGREHIILSVDYITWSKSRDFAVVEGL